MKQVSALLFVPLLAVWIVFSQIAWFFADMAEHGYNMTERMMRFFHCWPEKD